MNTYYIVVIGWSLYYLIQSFLPEVPWAECHHEWNTPKCRSDADLQSTCHSYYANLTMSSVLGADHEYHKVADSNGTLSAALLRNCTDSLGVFSDPVREYWE